MSKANERVIAALNELEISADIHILDRDTRTAPQAAEVVGCDVAQILKSLIFRTESGRALLAITSGANRVDVNRLKELVGERVLRADADFVRQATGYAIGGVPPVGHVGTVETFFDPDLFKHETVWAAAGTPNSLFPIQRDDLYKLAGDRIHAFTEQN